MPDEPRDYVIRKSGFFYRPNAQGYTSSAREAGLYTLGEAIRYSHPNGPHGPRDGITYHHKSTFPEFAAMAAEATKDAEIVRLRAALIEITTLRWDTMTQGCNVATKARQIAERALEPQQVPHD